MTEWNNAEQRKPRFAANVLASVRRPDGGLLYRVVAYIGTQRWAFGDGLQLPNEWVVEQWAYFDFAPGDSRRPQRTAPTALPRPYLSLEMLCRLRVGPVDIELMREVLALAAVNPEACGDAVKALMDNPYTHKAVVRWVVSIPHHHAMVDRSMVGHWRFRKSMLDWLIEQPEVRNQ